MSEKKMTIQELRESRPDLGQTGSGARVYGSARRRAMAVSHEAEALVEPEAPPAPKPPRKRRKAAKSAEAGED